LREDIPWGMILTGLLCIIAVVLFSTACQKGTSQNVSQEIVAGLGRDPGGVYGHAHHLQPLTRIFETLVSYGYHTEIIPQLATSWEVSEDGMTWTFHLRQGVLFHDGTPFDSEAARFALVMHNKKHPGHCGNIASIKAVDKYLLQVTHTEPFSPFLYELGWFLFAMASPSAFDEDGNIVKPFGTGPFKADLWIPDEKMILSRNDEYWGQRPRLKKITLKSIPDPATRIMALQTGEIDMIIDSGGVLPDDIGLLERDPEIQVLQSPQPMSHYLVLNCRIPPFSDPKVRRALLSAIDQQAIVENLLGVGKVASSILPSDIVDWHYPAFKTSYDPNRARALLKESGWRDGDGDGFLEKDGKVFHVMMLLTTQQVAMGPNRMITEHVQEKLRGLGIRADIQVLEKGAYFARVNSGEHHHILLGAYPFLGPHNVLYRSFHSKGDWNLRGNFYQSERMDALLDLGQRTMDRQKRRELYDEVQRLVCEDAVIIPLYESVLINAVRAHIRGYRLHPWFVVNWEDILVESPCPEKGAAQAGTLE
jgi:peptide/nickel transport system substrate-binding protein